MVSASTTGNAGSGGSGGARHLDRRQPDAGACESLHLSDGNRRISRLHLDTQRADRRASRRASAAPRQRPGAFTILIPRSHDSNSQSRVG
jgi:hypothetical protein